MRNATNREPPESEDHERRNIISAKHATLTTNWRWYGKREAVPVGGPGPKYGDRRPDLRRDPSELREGRGQEWRLSTSGTASPYRCRLCRAAPPAHSDHASHRRSSPDCCARSRALNWPAGFPRRCAYRCPSKGLACPRRMRSSARRHTNLGSPLSHTVGTRRVRRLPSEQRRATLQWRDSSSGG